MTTAASFGRPFRASPAPRVRHRSATGALVAVLFAALAAAACGNPVSPGSHVRPVRLTIHDGAALQVTASRTSVDGTLSLQPGQSPVLTVRFQNSAGDNVTPGSDYHLAVTSANAAVATWQPEQPGGFTGRIVSTAPGATTLTFRWMHGAVGAGHSDLDISVPVTVTAVTE